MKILLVQHLYFINGSGGTEKICSFLANSFVNNGHQVEIATNENISGKAIFKLHSLVKVTNIYSPDLIQKNQIPISNYSGSNPFNWLIHKIRKKYAKAYNSILKMSMKGEQNLFVYNLERRAKAWKTYIDEVKPDVIITMSIGSLLEITYNNEITVPIIDSVNGRPDYDYTNIFGGRKPFEVKLLKNSFQNLAGVQLLFAGYSDYLPDCFVGKVAVIPNPVPRIKEFVNHFISKDRYKVIHIARLDMACKQQHLAIESFAKLAPQYINWDFELWGVGSDMQRLQKQITDLNMEDRIFLKGFTEDPIQKLKEADIFIFPSKYEGFGLALAEAMSAGLPAIGFKSCSGVNEIIKHNETGFLVNDNIELCVCLEKLMVSPALRDQLGKNAKISIEDFSEESISEKWQKFVQEIVYSSAVTKNIRI
ncbi:glycosyltransferase [Sphingobacterium anhuiense]|uniref:Glycosyltransferase n=1 Tax=Sphingobacterium anhuiense TaxID=493780 RepID=A0ABW5Z1J7_9SPHI